MKDQINLDLPTNIVQIHTFTMDVAIMAKKT